jgi:glycosyl transferase family 92
MRAVRHHGGLTEASLSDPRAFLVFATNFKGESPYLREWLEYHLLVGVEHFYLYDQNGDQEASDLLHPYEKAGLVTRHPWTHLDATQYDGPTRFYQRNKNHMAFAHCARTYRDRFHWVMKIDIDEFLYPLQGENSVLPYLRQFDAGRVKGLQLPRINFGDSGHLSQPEGLVVESYTHREAIPSNHKDMANGAFLSGNRFCFSSHWWRYRWLRWGRLVRRARVTGLRVNHYYTKSLAEHLQRQNVCGGRGRTREDFAERNQGCNTVEDTGMLRFAPSIRAALARRGA